jgi:molybdate transport system substrate-binding protein
MIARAVLAAIALVVTLPAMACEDGNRKVLTVYAASSLTDAFQALAEAFEAANPGTDIRFNFAGSQVLATQLREGAAADLVATADLETMTALLDSNLVQDPVEFSSNVLVVATREGLREFDSVEDLAASGLRIAIAAPDVPAGRYAREVIDKATAEYGDDWRERVLDNVVSEETNVRAVLQRVQSGEADAGFVYRSDFTSLGRDVALGLLPFPARLAVAVVYPAALTAQPAEIVLARAFLEFVLSDEGQAILESFGFGTGL